MNKKSVTTLLFVISFLVLIALQSYYLYNSYRLEEKELYKQVNGITGKVLAQLEKYETDASEDSVILSLKKLSRNEQFMKQRITEKRQWYAFKNYYEKQVDFLLSKEASNTGFKIALKSEIYSVFDEKRKKELLAGKSPLVLFKTKAPVTAGFIINEGKWNSNFSERDVELKTDQHYHYIIKSRITAELLNVKHLIFIKIFPLFSISVLIMALLTYLFWRTLRNLKLQEMKVAQLYTSIDSITHELNTPLTTLKFSLASISTGETKELLERQIQRLERLVSSIHNNSVESDLLTSTDLDNYIIDLEKRFDQMQIGFLVEFKKNHTITRHDFEQILNNLVDNSAKYKSSEMEIEIKLGDQIFIAASDNGIGIPTEAQRYVFDKYYRVSRRENLQVNGLGLGLHIVKEIVEKYKGSINLASNPEKGVTFRIIMPHA